MTAQIAALYVDPSGWYFAQPEVYDCWDESRDARLYTGDLPVIAHPPCNVWCALAKANQSRYGIPVGSDGGCFLSALAAVERCGGVLEHPAKSLAWAAFGLMRPARDRWSSCGRGWVTEVSQVAYGHRARKRTWLYCVGNREPFALDWSEPQHTHQISKDHREKQLPVLSKKEARLTPPLFAQELSRLCVWGKGGTGG